MQLTEKTLRCMELGADKTLIPWCIVRYKQWIERIDKISSVPWNNIITYSDPLWTIKNLWRWKFDIIWHPLNRWRLWYLHRSNNNRSNRKAFDKMLNAFNKNIELYNQTILERQHNDELMDLILEFLESVN